MTQTAKEGHLGLLQYLVEQGLDKEKANNDGDNALMLAAKEGHLGVLLYLVNDKNILYSFN